MMDDAERGRWEAHRASRLLEGEGGVYCEDCNIAARWSEDLPPYSGVRAHAIDRDIAARLWTLSEELTGVSFAA